MNINEAFPSNYLKATDLQGREVALTISNVAMEKLGNDTRMILYFQGKQKGMVCNKTNAFNISMMYGEDTDGWLGKTVTLFAAWVEYQGKTVQGLRVKMGGMPAQGQHHQAPPAYHQSAAPTPQHGGPQNIVGNDDLNDSIPFSPVF